jgi:hypothetical protein
MERSATAAAENAFFLMPEAAAEAQTVASVKLQQKLADDFDMVPCLQCGKYQRPMVEALTRDFRQGGAYLAISVFAFAALLAAICGITVTRSGEVMFAAILATCAILVFFCGAYLYKKRQREMAEYDPNATDRAERMKTAEMYARSLADFRRYLQELGIAFELPVSDETAAQEVRSKRQRRPRLR